MTLLDAALDLAEMGYRVFPVIEGNKRAALEGWPDRATDDADTVAAWWDQRPDCNIGLSTAGLVVVDIDGESNPWPADADQAASLQGCPVSLTPGGGRHLIFRAPAGRAYRNSVGRVAPKVDIRADGGYIVAPPSAIGAKGYRWAPGCDLVDVGALPELPCWLAELLGNLEAQGVGLDDSGGPIPGGQRNEALTRIGGYLRRAGLTESEILAAMLEVNRCRCRPPLHEYEVKRIAGNVGRYEPDQLTTAYVECHYEQDDAAPWAADADPGPFPPHLLDVPGLVGEFARYALESAPREQPILSMAAGMALMGTLAGRRIMDDRGNRTNLYIIGIAPSGSGKEAPRRAVDLVARAADVRVERCGDLASDAGLISSVQAMPAQLIKVDEIGFLFESMTDERRAPPHLRNIAKELLQLYSQSDGVYRGKAYADADRVIEIDQPCLSLYGTTIPGGLWDNLTTRTLTNGLAARLLIFSGEDAPRRKRARRVKPPAPLVDMVRAWDAYRPGGDLWDVHPEPVMIEPDAGAVDLVDDLAARVDERMAGADEWRRALWARVEQSACRLSLIYAASRGGPGGVVLDAEAARWGVELAEYLARWLVYHASHWVARSLYEARQLRALRIIREAGGEMQANQLTLATRDLTKRERDEVIEGLKATGRLVESNILTSGPGRPRRIYKLPERAAIA